MTTFLPFLAAVSLLTQAPAPVAATEDACVKCHAALPTATLRAPTEGRAKDVHVQAKLTCTACHGGNAAGKNANEAHTGEFLGRPVDAAAVATLCGKCHDKPAANYKLSPHFTFERAPRRATCVTCHGSHDVQKATLNLIGEPLCSSCHDLSKPRRIWKALTTAESDFDSLEPLLAKYQGADAAELRARIKASHSELRGMSHAHNLLDITRKAAEAVTLTEDVRSKVSPRVEGLELGKWVRYLGMLVGGVLGLAAAGWIALWIRRRARHAPPLIQKRLRWAGITLAALALPMGIVGFKANAYIEHDAKFCTSCHIMTTAYQAWGTSGHKDVECHACHLPDLGSNLHQLWLYTTERPENVIKHAFVDRASCERCHTAGSDKTKWNKVAETPGHKQHVGKEKIECVQCHGLTVHRFRPTPELCKGCHTKVTLAAAGSMGEMHCLECHPFLAKDGARPLKPDRAVCLECHSDMKVKNESFPKDAPMNWACGECHKPHKAIRLSQADCLECHEPDLGKGIHAVKSHATCLSCHEPHGWKVTERTPCLKCHPDKKDHEPTQNCADCHGPT